MQTFNFKPLVFSYDGCFDGFVLLGLIPWRTDTDGSLARMSSLDCFFGVPCILAGGTFRRLHTIDSMGTTKEQLPCCSWWLRCCSLCIHWKLCHYVHATNAPK